MSESPAKDEPEPTDAARVGGWGTEQPAARSTLQKIRKRQEPKHPPISTEQWLARHLALAPRISDERWARIDAAFALMEDQQRARSVKVSQPEPE